jgi:hypothetical protein
MVTKMALVGALVLVTASVGQAVAGSTITDKQYWPNEAGPSAYKEVGRSPYAYAPGRLTTSASQPAISQGTCTYQGGPKSSLWSCPSD